VASVDVKVLAEGADEQARRCFLITAPMGIRASLAIDYLGLS
jgi:hypothetical protein